MNRFTKKQVGSAQFWIFLKIIGTHCTVRPGTLLTWDSSLNIQWLNLSCPTLRLTWEKSPFCLMSTLLVEGGLGGGDSPSVWQYDPHRKLLLNNVFELVNSAWDWLELLIIFKIKTNEYCIGLTLYFTQLGWSTDLHMAGPSTKLLT